MKLTLLTLALILVSLPAKAMDRLHEDCLGLSCEQYDLNTKKLEANRVKNNVYNDFYYDYKHSDDCIKGHYYYNNVKHPHHSNDNDSNAPVKGAY